MNALELQKKMVLFMRKTLFQSSQGDDLGAGLKQFEKYVRMSVPTPLVI